MKYLLLFISLISVCSVFAQTIPVSTATELQNALNVALPGQTIVLTDGIYYKAGGFKVPAGINGTSINPITLKGSKNAILTNSDPSKGYSLGLAGNSYWIIDGFTLYASQKGIVLDNSHHNIIQNLTVNKMGYEGIHLRTYSSYNTVQNCSIDSMGLVSAGTGEAIYIGSAVSNWSTYTGGNPDTCNYNSILSNSFGDHIGSENVDIKEGTTGGYIAFNTFNGKGLNGVNSGDSWIDVKGNYYRIECNIGNYTLTDGFQSHIAVAGWGNFNSFSNNSLTVNTTGYGINIQTYSGSQNSTALNNAVCSNNAVTGAGNGLTNITTSTNCTGSCTVSCTATITSSANTFCQGGSVVLTASAGASYKWFNGTMQAGTAATYTATDAGSYTVEVTNTAGCKATSAVKTITVTASTVWYADTDGDGKGDPAVTQNSCTQPSGYVATAGDNCPADPTKIDPGNCGCNSTETSCLDCAGVPNGAASIDACMICSGGTTGIIPITNPALCGTTTATTSGSNPFAIRALPNPFNDRIDLTIPEDAHIQVIDMRGSILIETDNASTLFTSQLPNGLYILRISTTDGTSMLKMMKQ